MEGSRRAARPIVAAHLPRALPFWWPPGPSQGSAARPSTRPMEKHQKVEPTTCSFSGGLGLRRLGSSTLGVPQGRYQAASDRSLNTPSASHTTGARTGVADRMKPPAQHQVKEHLLPLPVFIQWNNKGPRGPSWRDLAHPLLGGSTLTLGPFLPQRLPAVRSTAWSLPGTAAHVGKQTDSGFSASLPRPSSVLGARCCAASCPGGVRPLMGAAVYWASAGVCWGWPWAPVSSGPHPRLSTWGSGSAGTALIRWLSSCVTSLKGRNQTPASGRREGDTPLRAKFKWESLKTHLSRSTLF